MDESLAYVYSEPASPRRRTHFRTPSLTQTSASSQVAFPPRLKTPVVRERHTSTSVISNRSDIDILAPVPRRHHTLQAHQSRHWLGSPTPSVSSSRPVSPLSTVTSSPELTKNHRLTFSSLIDHDASRRSSLSMAHTRRSHQTKKQDEGGIGKTWVRWMHRHGLSEWVVPCAILASAWVKWAIGLGSYSGQGTPPMFGDYEAQRHWMELTIHLPLRQWYTYDLQYWGLDYPPLTAYVSWLCGIIGSWIDPTWFALDKSRGIETASSKIYMRASVLALDTLVYIPALLMFVRAWQGSRSSRTQHLALLTLFLHPALLLVDFGHFQYNSVMLGLTLLSANFFAIGQDLLGAFFFVLSLGFKQMALYYAPAVGSYLLGKCLYLGSVEGPKLFIRLGIVTVATFLLLFLPFLPPFSPLGAILDPITRIFPFNRGLFEDKVANFWCATNVAFKWKQWASHGVLVKLSTAFTAAGFLPGVVGLIYGGYKMQVKPTEGLTGRSEAAPAPTLSLLPYAMLTSSMSFFLFSFQVHEKTILLPLLPLTLLLSGAGPTSSTFELGALVNNVAVFSMWPLLKRDGLGLQYLAVTVLWNRLIGYNPFRAKPRSFLQFLAIAVYAACLALHILELLVSPPARLPDLFPVLNVLVSTPVFVLAWLWSIKRGIQVSWALGGLSSSSKSSKAGGGVDGHVSDGSATLKPLAEGIGREAGLRAKSLGYAQGRRRAGFRSSLSVDPAQTNLNFKRSSPQLT
ncbi:glycosyltransferase family 57 protein [Amylocystis lapponica]|nr:glycosyltransferase family 57 protein [Amylocystis lapponica]